MYGYALPMIGAAGPVIKFLSNTALSKGFIFFSRESINLLSIKMFDVL